MNVDTLNTYRSYHEPRLEFRLAKDPMNPVLTPMALPESDMDDIIERKIITTWIYPFIFTGNGGELSKVRCCRHCGRYFASARQSAIFCDAKCRAAHHYAHKDHNPAAV